MQDLVFKQLILQIFSNKSFGVCKGTEEFKGKSNTPKH